MQRTLDIDQTLSLAQALRWSVDRPVRRLPGTGSVARRRSRELALALWLAARGVEHEVAREHLVFVAVRPEDRASIVNALLTSRGRRAEIEQSAARRLAEAAPSQPCELTYPQLAALPESVRRAFLVQLRAGSDRRDLEALQLGLERLRDEHQHGSEYERYLQARARVPVLIALTDKEIERAIVAIDHHTDPNDVEGHGLMPDCSEVLEVRRILLGWSSSGAHGE